MTHVVDVTMENAQAQLIDESFKRPVVIDFWADWCAPCKALMPILEGLAADYNGAFLLAKVNADSENHIAAQFGVRSLPTVVLMKDGQPVDGFVGSKTPSEVAAFLDQHLPKLWEATLTMARGHMADQNFAEALPLLQEVYQQSKGLVEVMLDIAECYLQMNRLDEADDALKQIKTTDRDDRFVSLQVAIADKRVSAKSPELQALEAQFAENSQDCDIRFQLAMQLHQENEIRKSLEHLYELVRLDRQMKDGEVLQFYKLVLAGLGKGDRLAIEYQRRLFTLLY